jgi:hypothetical protein
MGRIPLSVVAPAAFCAGVLDAAADPFFYNLLHHLASFAPLPMPMILSNFRLRTPLPKKLSDRFPSSAQRLTERSFAHNLLLTYKRTRVQGILTQHIMQRKLKLLDESNSVATFLAATGLTSPHTMPLATMSYVTAP